MSNIEWAKNEVDIACERERGEKENDEEWDYGCACYQSALKAYNSLMEDGHSGLSFSITKSILTRLMNSKPLTPIDDVDEVWEEISFNDYKEYQCRRLWSLFKKVDKDGNVSYSDVDRVSCFNPDNGFTFYNGFVNSIISEMFPITMPYNPPTKNIRVCCEDFLVDPKCGDFDTIGIYYAIVPEKRFDEKVEINRFFKNDGVSPDYVEISKDEYEERRKIRKGQSDDIFE